MGFTKRIKYFLVHSCSLSNKEADRAIAEGKVSINGKAVCENVFLEDGDEVMLDGEFVRKRKKLVYLKFYKPRGYESTLSENVENNLSGFFREFEGLSIAGRLDKDSEGLLLLSNDGKWVQKIIHPQYEKEKEYVVEVNRAVNEDLLLVFRNGICVEDQEYQPAFCELISGTGLRIILKEGKNRQIRRICRSMDYKVISLLRNRVDGIYLEDMKPGEYRFLIF